MAKRRSSKEVQGLYGLTEDPWHYGEDTGGMEDIPTFGKSESAGQGSTTFTFNKEWEKEIQEAIARGEDPPHGYFSTQYPTSTRVFAYRYDQHDPNNATDSGLGTLYVQFHKRDDRYQYDNVEHGTYAAFATDGVSKGRFINSTLNHYHPHRAEDERYFTW